MKASLVSKFLATGLLASLLIGCGGEVQKSETKVTNGREIAEDTFPSVVLLAMQTDQGEGICTGTFVNDSQIISAGHCVEGLDPENPQLYLVGVGSQGEYVGKAKAVSFTRHSKYHIKLNVSPYDVSVINFEAGTAPAISPMATASPRAGDTLTIVGYGNNMNGLDDRGEMIGAGSGVKRTGTNKVISVSDGLISFDGLSRSDTRVSPGALVSSGSGDSGGPLFVDGKLAGITSGGGFYSNGRGGYIATSMYVDINSAYVKSYLNSALKK